MQSMGTEMLRDIAVLCKVPCQDTTLGSDQMYTNMTEKQLISAILKHDTTGVVTTAALELVEANALRARISQAPRKQVLQLFNLHAIKFEPGMPRREMAKIPTWEQLQEMLVSELSDGNASDDEPEVYVKLKPAPAENIDEPLPTKPDKKQLKSADAPTSKSDVPANGKDQEEDNLALRPAGGDDGGDDGASMDAAITKKRKRETDEDGQTEERQISVDALNGGDGSNTVAPTPMATPPVEAPAKAPAATPATAAAAPAKAPAAAPAAPAPAATAAPTTATSPAPTAGNTSTCTVGSNTSPTRQGVAQTAKHGSDSADTAADAKKSEDAPGSSALDAASAASSTAQENKDDNMDIDEKDISLPDPLPPPPSDVQHQMAKAYLKQVGLDAWYEHFVTQIPHTLNNVESLTSVTQSDLVTMAKGVNMMLDDPTVEQVLTCLKIQPIEEIVNVPWVEWARKEAIVASCQGHEQQQAPKKARLEGEKTATPIAATEAAEATADIKKKKKEDRKKSKPDPSLPKKPKGRLSAYMYFSKAMRPSVVKEHPEVEKNVTAQGKLMGQMWRQLSEKQKEPYTKLASEDAAREQKELEGYRDELLTAQTKTAATEATVAKMVTAAKGSTKSAGSAKSSPPPKKRARKEKPQKEKKPATKSKDSSTLKKKPATAAAAAAARKAADPLEIEARRILRHSAWPAEETAVLQNLVILQGEGRWTLKAHLLGTGRSPGQVKQHWVYLQAGRLKIHAEKVALASPTQVKECDRLLQAFREQTLAKEAAAEATGEIRDLTDNYDPLEGSGNPVPNELTDWGYYDTLEELHSLLYFLEPRGYKERHLLIRMRRILPLLAGAMATGRQVRCEAKGVGTIMGVDTEEFDSSTSNGSADCDVAAGVGLTDVRGLRLSVRYLDHSTALMSMSDVSTRLLPIDANDAARAIASPLQAEGRRSAANAAAKNAAAAIRSASTLGHLTKNQRPGLIPCHPADVCVARENAVCAKTGKKIVAWVDLIAWARETTPNPLKPNAPADYRTLLVCHAANRSDPWPEPDLKAKLGKRNKAKVDRDEQESTGSKAARDTPTRGRPDHTNSRGSAASPGGAQADAASVAAAKAYELAQRADTSEVAGEEEEERKRMAEEKKKELASRPDPERFCGHNKVQERFPHCIGILRIVGVRCTTLALALRNLEAELTFSGHYLVTPLHPGVGDCG